jgi:hypothetical protein
VKEYGEAFQALKQALIIRKDHIGPGSSLYLAMLD